jgi:hypothetical protein
MKKKSVIYSFLLTTINDTSNQPQLTGDFRYDYQLK